MSPHEIIICSLGATFVFLFGIWLYKAEFTRLFTAIPFWAVDTLRRFGKSKKINRVGPILVGALAFVYQGFCMAGQPHEAQASLVLYPLIALFLITAASAFTASVIDTKDSAEIHLASFIKKLSQVVTAKTTRLHDILLEAITSESHSERFINPKEQIDTIFSHGSEFFRENYGLTEEQIDITIISKGPLDKKWDYTYQHHEAWNHTPADKLMKKAKCLAKKCLETGHPAFYPDKIQAAKNGDYFLSSHDDQPGKKGGSVYCRPLKVGDAGFEWSHAITIVTYGKRLCRPHDARQVEVTEFFLLELCKRIQIELINRIIKTV
jgi:hypothetical protein